MHTQYALIALLIAICLIASFLPKKGRKSNRSASQPIFARIPLTTREQPMYFKLAQTFPEHIVLSQVSFSALLDSKHRPTRNTFNQKHADFVLCDKAFNVIAVIELDDASHKGRETQDANRQALLSKAGHRVIRYQHVPTTATLLADLLPRPQAVTIG